MSDQPRGLARVRRLLSAPRVQPSIPGGPRGDVVSAARRVMAAHGATITSRAPIYPSTIEGWYQNVSSELVDAVLGEAARALRDSYHPAAGHPADFLTEHFGLDDQTAGV